MVLCLQPTSPASLSWEPSYLPTCLPTSNLPQITTYLSTSSLHPLLPASNLSLSLTVFLQPVSNHYIYYLYSSTFSLPYPLPTFLPPLPRITSYICLTCLSVVGNLPSFLPASILPSSPIPYNQPCILV